MNIGNWSIYRNEMTHEVNFLQFEFQLGIFLKNFIKWNKVQIIRHLKRENNFHEYRKQV